MMQTKSQGLPTRKRLNEALEDLYDASLNTSASLLYDQLEAKIGLRFVDPKWLDDAAYFGQLLALIKDVLHHPLFDETLLNQEKSFIIDDIKTKESQKSYLASTMLTDLLLEGHPYHLPSKEEIPSIEAVTLDDVKAAYQELIVAPCLINVTGPLEAEALEELVKALTLTPASPPNKLNFLKTPIEVRDDFHHPVLMHQVYRFHVYDTGVYRNDPSYPAFQVFQHILGGDSDSILFKTIRETHSMAYSVAAVPSIKYGLLIIQASIDPEKTALYDAEIIRLMDEISTVPIDEDTLKMAKLSLQEGIKRNTDSSGVLARRALQHYLFDDPFEVDKHLAAIEAVTAEDLLMLAQRLKKVYAFQYGGENA